MSNLTTPLLGLVDVAVTGHIGAPVYIAAIAVGGAMFNMLYWLFNFLRMGSSGLTAQAWGAKDNLACRLVLYRALAIGAAIGTIMILLGHPLCKVVLQFMDADGDTAALAARYFAICIWGAPAVMCTYALAGWMVGVQDSRAAMWMAIITNIVNVLVSLSLVFGLGMRIEGVATGTTVAQWTGFAAGAIIVWHKYRPSPPPLRLVFERGKLIAFFRINFFIFLRTCCLVAVTMWFTHAGAVQGNDILAANAILLQLFMLFSFFIDGLAYAAEALAGKYVGAGDDKGLGALVSSLTVAGLVCALVFAAAYFAAGEWFMGLLAKDQGVVATAVTYLPWAVAVPLCGFAAFVFDGIFVGLVRPGAMLASMVAATALFFATYYAIEPGAGNHGLWLAFNTYLLMRGFVEILMWLRLRKAKARAKNP